MLFSIVIFNKYVLYRHHVKLISPNTLSMSYFLVIFQCRGMILQNNNNIIVDEILLRSQML